MTPEQYKRIGELFDAALERAAEERNAFLDQACGADAELRTEVEKLLANHVESNEFLSRPALNVAAALLAQKRTASLAGQTISHYRVDSLLGAGGMGEVWLARDTRLERQVALKLLPSQFTQDAERLNRFLREARAASALNHPNIITIYEIGEAGQVHFIAMEFIAGVTLRQRLANGRLQLREAVSIVRQMAAALDTAHQAGIIHRDIKPENVMLRPDGLVKVLDFGLARMTELPSQPSDPSLARRVEVSTQTGMVMGTPRYMSPEQARGRRVDARTDVFSLGVVFYEMITGEPAFAGATTAEVFAALLDKDPPPLRQFASDAPDELEEIISRMLAKECEERYASIRDFIIDLEQADLTTVSGSEDQPTRQFAVARGDDTKGSRQETRRQSELPQSQSLPDAGLSVWRAHRLKWLAAALALAGALGVGVWRWIALREEASARPATDALITPLIGQSGAKDHAAFSPDGRFIAFAWDGGRNVQVSPRDIYIKQLVGDARLQRLTSAPENDDYPVWTPDGNFVTFVRQSANFNETERNEVISVPAIGGSEKKLGETSSAAAWSPDGKFLAVSQSSKAAEGAGIFLLTPETGHRIRLTTPPSGASDLFPRFSPDGQMVAFTRDFSPTQTDIFVVLAKGGAPRQLTFEKDRVFGLAWTRDSRAIVYGGVRRNARGMWRIAVSGGAPERVPVTGQSPVSPDISPRGDRLIWTEQAANDTNLQLYRGPGFAGHAVPGKFAPPEKFEANSIHEDHSPDFSPDGQKLVFSSSRTGVQELWVSDADGKNAFRLTTQGGPNGSPRWSPDSKWIAFDSHTGGNSDIYVISAEGGPWRQLTNEKTAETQPAWSRDGQWIYFKSNRSGSYQIYKMPAAGGAAKQITFNGGFEGFESPDGSLFYYTRARGAYGIYAVPASGGEEKLVPELSRAGYWRSWVVVREGICFIAREDAPQQTIRFFSFATRRVTPLVTVSHEALWWQPGLALSPDGRRLLFARLENINDEIMLMDNFR
jgi:Tol biopolymer transport system component/serine/threonine protein kinase